LNPKHQQVIQSIKRLGL